MMDDPTAPLVKASKSFPFGKNWQRFLRRFKPERLYHAKVSLLNTVGDLRDKSFMDVGCGSGLFSLGAIKLGAKFVASFDSDIDAVRCAFDLRSYFYLLNLSKRWLINWGSILDDDYLSSMGTFDVVYAWGVLHHTGDMKLAMENISRVVAPNGRLFVSIYNDQGGASKRWRRIKQIYNSCRWGRWSMLALVFLYFESRHALRRLIRGQTPLPFKEWRQRRTNRGMSMWYDLQDWVGGLPFEVAKPEEIVDFYLKRGFRLMRLQTCGGGHGCNTFLFSLDKR